MKHTAKRCLWSPTWGIGNWTVELHLLPVPPPEENPVPPLAPPVSDPGPYSRPTAKLDTWSHIQFHPVTGRATPGQWKKYFCLPFYGQGLTLDHNSLRKTLDLWSFHKYSISVHRISAIFRANTVFWGILSVKRTLLDICLENNKIALGYSKLENTLQKIKRRDLERKKKVWDYTIKSTGNDASSTQTDPSNYSLGI